MKKIIIFLFIVFAFTQVKSIGLKIAATETNGLVQFLMGCERQNDRNALFVLLKNSPYYTEEAQKMLQQWNEIEKYNQLKFEGFPESRHNGRMVSDLIVIQSVKATNAHDLAQRCMGYFTPTDLKKFRTVLLYFEPVYHALVWQPHIREINAQLKTLQDFVRQKNIDELFNKAAGFYGAKWEEDFPFYVMVNPLPGKVQHTSARPMGQVLIADFVLGEKDLVGWLGVVFHEMCHVLYRAQPMEKQMQIEKLFYADRDSLYRLAAYNWLDETLATALGNGWLVEHLNGKTDTSEWYNNHYINRFAHATYPLVKEYAEMGKPIDETFIQKSISVFAAAFPEINHETEHLFTFIEMVADTMPQNNYDQIFNYFFPRSFSCQTPFENDYLYKANDAPGTKVLVITSERTQKLNLLKERLNLEIPNDPNAFVYYTLENNGRNYFVLVLNNIQQFGRAMELVATQKQFAGKTGTIPVE